MRPAVKHWLFFAFLLVTLAALVAFVLYQWSRLDEGAPAPGPGADPLAPAPGPASDPPGAAAPLSRGGSPYPPRGKQASRRARPTQAARQFALSDCTPPVA